MTDKSREHGIAAIEAHKQRFVAVIEFNAHDLAAAREQAKEMATCMDCGAWLDGVVLEVRHGGL